MRKIEDMASEKGRKKWTQQHIGAEELACSAQAIKLMNDCHFNFD